MDAPTPGQRRFLELLRARRKEHEELAGLFDFDNAQVVAEVIDTYERTPPWVLLSVPIPAMVSERCPAWYELTEEGRAALADL